MCACLTLNAAVTSSYHRCWSSRRARERYLSAVGSRQTVSRASTFYRLLHRRALSMCTKRTVPSLACYFYHLNMISLTYHHSVTYKDSVVSGHSYNAKYERKIRTHFTLKRLLRSVVMSNVHTLKLTTLKATLILLQQIQQQQQQLLLLPIP